MAKSDPDGRVRGQALLWLVQKARDRAVETIEDTVRDDPDEDVEEEGGLRGVAALYGETVPALIHVARTNRNAEVRRPTILWLGQTRDRRALASIEEILEH